MEFVGVKDAAYRYACSLLHSREEAEDLVQDLYEKLWRRRLLVRKKGFAALVMVSVRNMCMDILRNRHREWESGDVVDDWEGERDKMDMVQVVEKLVERLPQKEREAFHLRVVEGLDYGTVSEIMGIGENAARMACSRGKAKVKEELEKIMGYGLQQK